MSDEAHGKDDTVGQATRAERPGAVAARRILVPVDFSACSLAALEHAVGLAQRFGSAIDVVHVWQLPRTLGREDSLEVAGHRHETVAAFAESQTRRALDAVVFEVAQRGVVVRTVIENGMPAESIVRLAGLGGYDLVVMGTHGHTGLAHLLRGSVAEQVVRRAPCPVLTIRVVDPIMHQGFEEPETEA
jgi:universal stress protein A